MKKKLNKIIPSNLLHFIVSTNKKRLAVSNVVNKKYGTIDIADQRDFHVYEIPGNNVFFGYYDLQQYNSEQTKLLAHICNSFSLNVCFKCICCFIVIYLANPH